MGSISGEKSKIEKKVKPKQYQTEPSHLNCLRSGLRRLSSMLWRAWVDICAWIARVSGEAENPGPERPQKKARRNVNDLRIGFLNAHSLGENTFRQYLLNQYRRKFDIFAVAETWCPDTDHERHGVG
jgi:hypothetical protein